MGIPRFAAWLTKKFPPMVRRDAPESVHGLYIDMNGIIHPCCHSEEDPSVAKRTEEEKIEQVCLAVGNLVEVAKPTHILFLAMDGVAPRAKMNQQRARRYMSAVPKYGVGEGAAMIVNNAAQKGSYGKASLGLAPRDKDFSAKEHADADKALKDAEAVMDMGIYGSDGVTSPSPNDFKTGPAHVDEDPSHFDSNCISPGTVFMKKCSDRLKAFVAENLATNAAWKGLAVVVSDTNTPGEGEHKIIDFIRTQIGYGSSWSGMGSHVIHGNDADLILLCLGLHIPRVVICRENYRSGTHNAPAPAPTAAAAAEKKDGDDDKKSDASASDKSGSDASDASDDEAAKKEEKAKGAGGGKGKGRGKGGRRARFFPPKPRFEWYDIDVVGGCLTTELYELSKKASPVLKAVPDYQVFSEGMKKKLVVGPGGVGQLVDVAPTAAAASLSNKQRKDARKAAPPLSEEEAVANNHAQFATRALVPTSAETGLVLAHPCTLQCNHRLIDDFITLATLMGNDFMPRLPSCFCGDSAMDNIMEVYVRCVLPYGFLSNPVTTDLDLRQLHRFFHGYAMVETTLFRQHCIKEGLLTPDEAMSLSAESLGAPNGTIKLPSPIDEKWRSLYYGSTTIGTSKQGLERACTSYIEGIRFVLRYYSTTSRTTSWSWYFPFHHSPFAADLANFIEPFLKSSKPEDALPPPRLELVAPLPFPQLMAILPPTSSALLPKAIGQVMRKPPAALAGTFPSEWKIDFAAADGQEHLAAVLLPFADFKVLIDTAEACKATFTEEETVRNVNVAEQCVLICRESASDAAADSSSAAAANDDAVAKAAKIIEDRVRGGIAFQKVFADAAKQTESSSSSATAAVLEFSYVDIPSKFYNKAKTYSATYKPLEELEKGGGSAASRDEKNAKRYKRRTDQTSRSDSCGYRYWPKKFLAATEKGWFMSLADFHLGVGAIAAFTGFAFTVASAPTAAAASTTCLGGLLVTATVNAIVTGFIFALGAVLLCVLGVGITNPRKDSGIKRNNTREAYVDWLCAKCLSQNFSRNEKCFTCGAPCDETSSSWALFSNKMPRMPAHFDPNHKPHVVDIVVKFPEEEPSHVRAAADTAASPTKNLVTEDVAVPSAATAASIADPSPTRVTASSVVAAVLDSAVEESSRTPTPIPGLVVAADEEEKQKKADGEDEEGNCDMI